MTSRRRRLAGALAALSVAAGLVLAGSMAAQADAVINFGPPSPGDGATLTLTTSPITFAGTTTNTLYTDTIDVQDYSSGSPDPMCSGIDPSSGAWSCDWTFSSPGAKEVRVEQGANSDILEFTLVLPTHTTTGPALVPAGGTVSLVGGNAYPFATMSAVITTPNEPGLTCGPNAVNGDGTWSCDIPFDAELPPDSSAVATITQDYGGDQVVTTHAFDIAAAPPTSITIDTPTEGQVVAWDPDPFLTIAGRAPTGGGPVDVEVDGGSVGPCTGLPVDAYGSWSCGPIDVAAGETEIVARQGVDEDAVTIDVQAPHPPLACAYSPNGGVRITSEEADVVKSVYLLTPYTGGGAGGSGSGGSGSGDGGYELADQGYCNGSAGYADPSVTEWNDDFVANCGAGDCNLSGLAAGIYEVYHSYGDGSAYYTGVNFDYLFRIPTGPAITTVASTTNSVIVRGTAVAGDAIRIVRSNESTLCSTTATASGQWACQFPKSSASSARAISIDPQSGGMSAYSASRSIPIFVPAAPDSTPTPTLVSWFLEFSGDLMNLRPGDSFTINVSGMPEGTTIEVWLHSTPRLLGTATGTGLPMAIDLTVPDDVENGAHEIEMIAVTPLGTTYFFTSDANVTGGVDPVDEEDPGTEEPADGEGAPGSGSGAGTADRGDPAAPSALTESIATLERIVANPLSIAVAGGLAISLLFLVALPTELLNNSLSSNTNRLGRAYGAVDRAFTRLQDWFIRVTRTRVIAAILLTTIVALIYGFVDPRFGFDLVSLRLVLSLGLAFFILSYGASWLSGFVTRRLWGVQNTIVLQPSIILFAVLGVVVARLLDFSPGFLVGIAIGLELVAASKRVVARAVLVQFAFVVGLALLAWIGYSLFVPGDDFLGMLTEDMLVAVTAEGLTGAMIAIFPLRFLDGRDIWDDSKPLWLAAFVVVATAFALLVLPTALEGSDVGDYGVWVLVFAAFGAIALLVWFFFVRAAQAEERAEREKVDA